MMELRVSGSGREVRLRHGREEDDENVWKHPAWRVSMGGAESLDVWQSGIRKRRMDLLWNPRSGLCCPGSGVSLPLPTSSDPH